MKNSTIKNDDEENIFIIGIPVPKSQQVEARSIVAEAYENFTLGKKKNPYLSDSLWQRRLYKQAFDRNKTFIFGVEIVNGMKAEAESIIIEANKDFNNKWDQFVEAYPQKPLPDTAWKEFDSKMVENPYKEKWKAELYNSAYIDYQYEWQSLKHFTEGSKKNFA